MITVNRRQLRGDEKTAFSQETRREETQGKTMKVKSIPDRTWLPLHQACRDNGSLDFIQQLVESQPSALSHWATPPEEDPLSSQELRLPLHVACEAGASLEVIRYLVQQNPTALQAVAPCNMYTALDFALYNFHSIPSSDDDKTRAEQVIRFLENANPIYHTHEKENAVDYRGSNSKRHQAVFRKKSKSSKIIRIRLPATTTRHCHHPISISSSHHHHQAFTICRRESVIAKTRQEQ